MKLYFLKSQIMYKENQFMRFIDYSSAHKYLQTIHYYFLNKQSPLSTLIINKCWSLGLLNQPLFIFDISRLIRKSMKVIFTSVFIILDLLLTTIQCLKQQ